LPRRSPETRTRTFGKRLKRFREARGISQAKFADLLNDVYAYAEPDIDGFEQAVAEFKERVPDLARGLDAKIKQAHKDNVKFQTAFDGFFALCQTALNPNISRDAVDEMLAQRLLTQRESFAREARGADAMMARGTPHCRPPPNERVEPCTSTACAYSTSSRSTARFRPVGAAFRSQPGDGSCCKGRMAAARRPSWKQF
jgi:transcriptional regulator with XRE-family HTH domain